MKIGIDLRAIIQGKYSGVEEYTLNLLHALFEIDPKNQYILFTSGEKTGRRYLDFVESVRQKNPNIKPVHLNMPNRLLNLSFKLFGYPKIDGLMGGVDVVFEPNINLLPVSPRAKTVVTFHDLSFEKYKDFFSHRQNFWHNFVSPKSLANKADSIIAVSESTKQDLVEIYKIPAKKIKVVYSGIGRTLNAERKTENEKLKNIKKKYNLPEKFILYLGTIEPRKNIIGLIKAFEIFKTSYKLQAKNCKLVIAGSKGWLYEDVFHTAKLSGAKSDIIFTGLVADEDKNYLYELASLFVYPSFYEGFGFPPLEAMVAGVPVITSDCSSLPETAGDAALMVNPYDVNRMAWFMKEILSDEGLRRRMIAKGYEQAKKFSWEKCARETLGVLESIK